MRKLILPPTKKFTCTHYSRSSHRNLHVDKIFRIWKCVLRYRSMEKLKQEISKPTLINVENLSVETSENQYFIGINRPPKEEHNNKTLDLVIKTNIIQSTPKKFHLWIFYTVPT